MKRASLLLDLDNTLIDRDAAFDAYLQDFMLRNGPAFGGRDKAQVQAQIMAMDCRGRKGRTLFCREVLQRFPELPYTEEGLWADHQKLPRFVQPDPAVHALLGRLALEYQLVVISNGSANMQRGKIFHAGIADFFAHILISGEIGFQKPDHRFFLHALACCSQTEVVVVGDDDLNDIQPAIAMQLKTIHINPEGISAAIKPDRVLASIHGLEEALACMI